MKKLTNKQLVEMAVKIIYSHLHSKDTPVMILSKEQHGDHHLRVHRSGLAYIYKVTDALHVVTVILHESPYSPGYFLIDII